MLWNSKPPPGCGSGKFVTPLARMHLANASAPGAPVLDRVECVVDVVDVVDLVGLVFPFVAAAWRATPAARDERRSRERYDGERADSSRAPKPQSMHALSHLDHGPFGPPPHAFAAAWKSGDCSSCGLTPVRRAT